MNRFFYRIRKDLKKKVKKIIYPSPEKKDIISLIERLRPIKTDKELIRLGGKGDGGYLVPNDLENIEACFSPGVGNIAHFEKDCAKTGMKVFMADASVENPFINNSQYSFIKKYLGNRNNEQFIKLSTWIKSTDLLIDSDLILQMDIEGSEFEVLLSTSTEQLKRFRIILIEFHDLHNLWDAEYYRYAKKTFSKLLINHVCVHIHPNNSNKIETLKGIDFPPVAEFTFIRKDRIREMAKVKSFPHPLDKDNLETNPIVLPKIWYS